MMMRPTLLLGALALSACSGTRPANLGVNGNRLLACPPSPNCVSSFETDDEHAVEPLLYTTSLEEAREEVMRALGEMTRVEIVVDNEDYVHAEFTSAIWRFVDDVELYFVDADKLIHVRSASRVGHSDMGANRERIESLRAATSALRPAP